MASGTDSGLSRLREQLRDPLLTLLTVLLVFWMFVLAPLHAAAVVNTDIIGFFLALAVPIAISEHDSSQVGIVASLAVLLLALKWPRATIRGLAAMWCLGFVLVLPLDFLAYNSGLHQVKWLPNSFRARVIIWEYTAERVLEQLGHHPPDPRRALDDEHPSVLGRDQLGERDPALEPERERRVGGDPVRGVEQLPSEVRRVEMDPAHAEAEPGRPEPVAEHHEQHDEEKLRMQPAARKSPPLPQPDAEDHRQHRARRHDAPEQLALHQLEAFERQAILAHRVVDEQARQVKKAGEPGHHEYDVQRLDPEHRAYLRSRRRVSTTAIVKPTIA